MSWVNNRRRSVLGAGLTALQPCVPQRQVSEGRGCGPGRFSGYKLQQRYGDPQ